MNNKIFISSTCFDLIDIRAELRVCLEALGFTPIMSDQLDCEFGTFPDKNSIETCLINLRSCDTVIFILSQRYGGNLSKAGFGDYSATHLEYLEAKKTRKRIIFFVRDRLQADFDRFKKDNTVDLLWVEKKDQKIFEIIEDRIKLTHSDIDNWKWTFRDVIEIKERIKREFETEVRQIRLNKLIESGNTPLLTVTATAVFTPPKADDITMSFSVDNVGPQTAIEPVFVLYKADTFKEVLEKKLFEDATSYQLKVLSPLKPLSSLTPGDLIYPIKVSQQELVANKSKFVVGIIYKTIHGDLVTDASEITLVLNLRPQINVISRYTSKHLVNTNTFEKLIGR